MIGYFLNAALYLCLTVFPYNEREISWFENTQVVLLVILVEIILFEGKTVEDRATLMIFGQACDPNFLVGFIMFPFSVAVKRVIERKYRLIYLVLVCLSIYCVFLTGSRGGLIAIAVMIASFALIYPTKVYVKLIFLIAGVTFILVAWLIAVPWLPKSIIERMSIKSVIETGGTGRWSIWMSMLNTIVNSPEELLFGHGFYGANKIFFNGTWHKTIAHSQIIQVLFEQGIVGLISFLALTIGCILRCIKKRKTVSIAIIGMMALSISLSFNQTTRTFWNLVAYAAMIFPESQDHRSVENLELPEDAEP